MKKAPPFMDEAQWISDIRYHLFLVVYQRTFYLSHLGGCY